MSARSVLSKYVVAVALALGVVYFLALPAAAQGISGAQIIIRLRLAGDVTVLPLLRPCLIDMIGQYPDVKVATQPTDGVRFVADIIASKDANGEIVASSVIVETFPMEEFQPKIKPGEDADALLKRIRYYTLQRLHEIVSAPSPEAVCKRIATAINEKVLSAEYVARND
jgi:hypothetical protein